MNNEGQSTIYDVAKMAGVSSATVSRVLNSPSKVSKENRNKVLDAIIKLNFVPKADAVANARKLYKRIGVIAPFFTQISFMERLRGITETLAAKNHELVMYSVNNEADLKEYITIISTSNRIDALILLCLNPDTECLKLLRSVKFPICFVENEVEGFDCVGVQNLKGGQRAAEYLFNAGVRKPAFIGEKTSLPYSIASSEERFRGFRFFFANQGIVVEEKYVWFGEFYEKKLDEGIQSIICREDLPDGIFCSSDLIAARLIRLANLRGIRIPQDIKVIGFDNIDMAQHIGLTSVNQSLDDSGRIAAEFVLKRLENNLREFCTTFVPVKVIERETT